MFAPRLGTVTIDSCRIRCHHRVLITQCNLPLADLLTEAGPGHIPPFLSPPLFPFPFLPSSNYSYLFPTLLPLILIPFPLLCSLSLSLVHPRSVWTHLFCGAGHEKRRGEQLKWSLAFRLYIGSFVFRVHSYQFIQPGWAECVLFSLGLYFVFVLL